MKKSFLGIVLFLTVSAVSYAQDYNWQFESVLRFNPRSINTFRGVLFNDYPILNFELKNKFETKSFEIFADLYTYFKADEPNFYTEYGLFVGFKKKLDWSEFSLKPLLVGWTKKGKRDWGVVPIAELKFKTIANPTIEYGFSRIVEREDLRGDFLRLSLGGKVGTIGQKGNGVVEAKTHLIYNSHFFREESGFVFAAEVLVKKIRISRRLSSEMFFEWTYARGIVNELMIGLNIDLSIIQRRN